MFNTMCDMANLLKNIGVNVLIISYDEIIVDDIYYDSVMKIIDTYDIYFRNRFRIEKFELELKTTPSGKIYFIKHGQTKTEFKKLEPDDRLNVFNQKN